MALANIRTEIKNILETVTDIGMVHDYERWANDWASFINLFKVRINGKDQIRGWEIGRKAVREKRETLGVSSGGNERIHVFVIRGYLSLKDADATEKVFNDLIESVAAAFRGNKELNGTADDHDFIQAEVIDMRMFGSVLCHYAELSLMVYETI